MKILLIAVGTRGDVQPFVVLGTRLIADGHQVHLCTAAGFADAATKARMIHHPLPMDFQELLQQPDMQAALHGLRGKFRAYRWAGDLMNQQLSAMWQTGKQLRPDLILYHFKGAMAPYLGRHFGIPAWPVMLQPGFAPTRAYPQFLLAARSKGSMFNLASHRFIQWVMRTGTKVMLKRWLRATGTEIGPLMDVQAGWDPKGPARRIHAYSPHITPLASDMAATETQVGYFFAPPEPFEPPIELQHFLAAGETPIYVGFGSMPGTNHERVNTAVIGALKKTGLRAVVATGWGGIGDLAPGPRIHVLQSIPHSWLFPKTRAVVHHGGSGTTHEGLRWGRASVVCPLFADQPFFGQRVAELGAGPAPIPQKKLTAERLARGLEFALAPATQNRAARIGEQMRHEDGADTLARLVS